MSFLLLAEFPASVTILGITILLVASCAAYRYMLPTPIPGIPYNRASASRLFGDVPDALKHFAETSEMGSFLDQRCKELNSPIVQLFMRPFRKPWVVIADDNEAHDILVRRTPHDFDRSKFHGDMFRSMLAENQVHMPTGDQWNHNRRLMADTMSPSFLRNVAGPGVHAVFSEFVDLWRKKAMLSRGHPFEVTQDVEDAMLDSILAVAFGESTGATESSLQLVTDLTELREIGEDPDVVARFPQVSYPASYLAIRELIESGEIPMNSPFGWRHHDFALRFYPSLRNAVRVKENFITEKLNIAWGKSTRSDASEDDIKCAADLIVEREVNLARREGRQPQYDSRTVRDELFGFLVAGHDTTAAAVQWGLSFLIAYPDVQSELYESLEETFRDSVKLGQSPDALAIAKAVLPYLDAVVEETVRMGGTGVIRSAAQDTTVLGYRIPKGTDVFMLSVGVGYTAPPLDGGVDQKSSSGDEAKLRAQADLWHPSTLSSFQPKRWMRADGKGDVVFNPRAGYMHGFGGGVRGCFGRKLARLALRIILTLIVWNFELQPLPAELAGTKAKDGVTHRPQHSYVRLCERAVHVAEDV